MINEAMNTLMKEEDNIKNAKSPGVSEAFHKIADLINLVLTERPSLRKARKAVVEAAIDKHAINIDPNVLNTVSESLARQEAGLKENTDKLAKMEDLLSSQADSVETLKDQGSKMDGIIAAVGDNAQPTWTVVVKKKKKGKEPAPKAPLKETRIRKKNPAILVKANAEDFPALAKKLRGNPNISTDNKVVAMRKTRTGDMLIEVEGDEIAVGAHRMEIALSELSPKTVIG